MQDMQFEDPNEFKDTIESWSGNVSKLEAKARRIESIEVCVCETLVFFKGNDHSYMLLLEHHGRSRIQGTERAKISCGRMGSRSTRVTRQSMPSGVYRGACLSLLQRPEYSSRCSHG